MQNRWKSKVVIGTILAQVVALLLALGVIDIGLSEKINVAIVAVLEILVSFGILNNPTDKDNF